MSCHLDNTTVLLQIRPGYVPSMMLTGFELGARGNVASDVQSPGALDSSGSGFSLFFGEQNVNKVVVVLPFRDFGWNSYTQSSLE